METQNYKNHRLYYTPHHFIFYPAILILAGAGAWCCFHYPDRSLEFGAITIIFLMIGWLGFMLRQHYALGNQNRIIRLELRLRYFQLTGTAFEPVEKQLTLPQLIALRFAPDEQLQMLIQNTIDKKLSPDDIKRSVNKWQADYMRI